MKRFVFMVVMVAVLFILGGGGAFAALDQGLVTWHDFNVTGAAVTDYFGINTMTVTAAAAIGPSGLIGRGANLNDTNYYGFYPNDGPIDEWMDGTNSWTIVFWFRARNVTATTEMFFDNAGTGTSIGRDFASLSIDGSIDVRANSGSNPTATFGIGLDDFEWHHLVISYRNGSNRDNHYVDGVLAHTGPSNTSAFPVQQENFRIFSTGAVSPGNYFKGDMDEWYFYNRSLGKSEVELLYFNGVSGETYPFISYPVANASIVPDPAFLDSDLTATYDDNEYITAISYRWFKDGAEIVSAIGSTLNSGNFSKGDAIIVEIMISYGGYDSYDNSSELTISNSAPSVSGVSIVTYPTYTTSNLTGSYTPYDADGDGDSATFRWFKGDVLIGGQTGITLLSGNFAVTDVVKFEVTPYDGETYGTPVNSSGVTISLEGGSPNVDYTDDCYDGERTDNSGIAEDFKISNNCAGGTGENGSGGSYIIWGSVDLQILGDVVDDEVIIGDAWMYVDSAARPDLDAPATLVFKNIPFAIEPTVLVDGVVCGSCNATHSPSLSQLQVEVPGFSNYSLTGKQEFTVYSDDEPYLGDKVYLTIDLGDSLRVNEYACIVQIFARNAASEWILAQTNPERAVQGKLFGDTDPNQPESLGYFPTVNGIANAYFRDDKLYGYMELQRVIQCTANGTAKLVHEEAINTRYFPAGRGLTARLVWLNDEDNAFYLSFIIFGGLIVLWMVAMIYRRSFR